MKQEYQMLDCFWGSEKKLASDLCRIHYNPKKAIIVASDASNLGLGTVILHKDSNRQVRAIEHASRNILSAEKGYIQIKREALGIIFVEKSFID